MKKILFSLILFFLTIPHICFAKGISLIRDTEIEGVLTSYAQKIFKAANLNPNNARVLIINDDSFNAFVAGGQTIFVHSGLLTQSNHVDDLMFVLSHETGHIAGGHITRGIGALEQANATALISTILGGLVAVAGRPDAGVAVMMGGNTSAAGLYTSYRQTEESSADRIAADIMQTTGYSMLGFQNTMKLIKMQDRLTPQDEWNYLRTHPLSQNRVSALSRFLKNPKPLHEDIRFELIKAKLIGFLYPPYHTFDVFKNQNTLPALYALSIAHYRNRNLTKSLSIIDQLIKAKPNYPYFYELKAQFLFETGQIEPAITYYDKALQFISKAPLIRLSLAQALLETNSQTNASRAVNELKQVLNKDNQIPFAWQLLATAYERTNKTHLIPYAMAELYLTHKDIKSAQKMAKKALTTLSKESPEYIRSQDILSLSIPKKSNF